MRECEQTFLFLVKMWVQLLEKYGKMVLSLPGQLRSLFPKQQKVTGSLCDYLKKGKVTSLLSCLLALWQMWRKLGWRTGAVQRTANKPK